MHGTIHCAVSPTKVVRMRNLELGRTAIKIGNIILPIFDRERTIVDTFRYLGRETVLKALNIALTKKTERIETTWLWVDSNHDLSIIYERGSTPVANTKYSVSDLGIAINFSFSCLDSFFINFSTCIAADLLSSIFQH